jgi:hypothetical protein
MRGIDKRYGIIRALLKEGERYRFKDVFDVIPKTIVAKDLGMNYHTFTRKVEDPERFTLKEIIKMAGMFAVGSKNLCDRIFIDIQEKKERRACEDISSARDNNTSNGKTTL